MKIEELKKDVKKYVEKWMDGHETDTFIKNEHGVYLYSAGPTSLNLKVYFESLLEDFIESKLSGDDFISCTGCDKECADIETMKSDSDSNWFCPECWKELAPGMRKDYEELKAKGEID